MKKKLDDLILREFAKKVDGKYKGAKVNVNQMGGEVQQIEVDFFNSLDNTLCVAGHEGKIHITALSHCHSDRFKSSAEWGQGFKWVDMDTLLEDFDKCVKRLKMGENGFYKECEEAMTDFGMSKEEQNRINMNLFGERQMIGGRK